MEKTTIADLTEPADIANGTFYRFYDSKKGDPEILAAVMGVVKFVAYHKDDFHDESFYRAVRDAVIETVAAGLTTDAGE